MSIFLNLLGSASKKSVACFMCIIAGDNYVSVQYLVRYVLVD